MSYLDKIIDFDQFISVKDESFSRIKESALKKKEDAKRKELENSRKREQKMKADDLLILKRSRKNMPVIKRFREEYDDK